MKFLRLPDSAIGWSLATGAESAEKLDRPGSVHLTHDKVMRQICHCVRPIWHTSNKRRILIYKKNIPREGVMLRVPSLFLATIVVAILGPTLGLAETPKRGGILSFASVAETSA